MSPLCRLLGLSFWAVGVFGTSINRNWANLEARDVLRSCLSKAVGLDDSRVQFPEEPNFNDTDLRPFNLNLQYAAFAITYPNTTQEVSDIVLCAGTHDRKVQARSGGRDFINKCLGGAGGAIVVDLKSFNTIEVDQATQIATADGNRYIPHGSSPLVGVGGHLMVGGMGYSSRQNGLSIDALTEVEVVLANGTVTRASETSNPDLFWAMRGAGASFGIATEFNFQTKPEPETVVSWTYNFTSNDPAVLSEAWKAYHEIVRDPALSLKLGGTARLVKSSFIISGAFFGSEAAFNDINLGGRLPSTSTTTITPGLSWMEFIQDIFDSAGSTASQAYFYTSDTGVTPDTMPSNSSIDAFLEHIFAADDVSSNWSFLLDLYGGKINDVATNATAFPHRDVLYFLTAYVSTTGPTTATTERFHEDAVLKLQSNEPEKYGSYAGVPSLGHENSQEKYWGSNLARLEIIKARFDPDDVFSMPQNVKPAGSF
ncbi:hypothetical protein AK830_g1330 [Neonectria ditissima]|uniref:FAD-binding PCMH-type domain-containing protein n=1 Tax=Neonectria ditissima TaxID=78410 RepID=A0A0N8H8P6_9HYPO|nr:hypothetical protein AK830_g1330 [Neonectria ditissima]